MGFITCQSGHLTFTVVMSHVSCHEESRQAGSRCITFPSPEPASGERVLDDLVRDPTLKRQLGAVADLFEALWHHRSHGQFESLKRAYECMDPDGNEPPSYENSDGFVETLEEMLANGNWEKITEAELQAALDGEDVFPISLDVRFDELLLNRLYKLGELETVETRSSFFGLKKESVTITVYDRVIQVLRFKDKHWFESEDRMPDYPGDSATGVHLRLFKSVPKLDLETIYPNTRPNMRTLDKLKIAAPLVGGLVALAIKFGPLLFGKTQGETSLAVVIGIVSALKTYMVKSYMSYRTTREKYLAHVSKDLYFKGQANNGAVLNVITDLSEEQEVKGALLAYCFLWVEADAKYTQAALDHRVEGWLGKTFGVTVDFEVDDALSKLKDLNLLRTTNDGILSVVDPSTAIRTLCDAWQNIHGREKEDNDSPTNTMAPQPTI